MSAGKQRRHSPQATPDSSAHCLLALLHLPGVGRKTAFRFVSEHTTVASLEIFLKESPEIDPAQLAEAHSYAVTTLARSEREGIRVLGFLDRDFPPCLKQIEDPPLLLHIKGDIGALAGSFAVAIIGTREPTSFGERAARKIATTAAKDGAVVVSGLARGCDAAAHWGCIDAKGRTVAVLAHGLDKIYPAENKPLADEILSNGGCLISEYEIGQRVFKTNFVDRDRLQSGLSRAVILIESGVVGGSMHTIRFAQQQHRAIGCLKHPPDLLLEDKVQGNLKLIADGKATPLANADDLLSFLATLRQSPTQSPESKTPPSQLSMF